MLNFKKIHLAVLEMLHATGWQSDSHTDMIQQIGDERIMYGEGEKTMEDTVIAHFKVTAQHISEETE